MADEPWYFPHFYDFGQSHDTGYVIPLPPETVFYRLLVVLREAYGLALGR